MNQPSQDRPTHTRILAHDVAKALERKRRLEQYAVIWRDGKIVRINPVTEQEAQAWEEGGVSRKRVPGRVVLRLVITLQYRGFHATARQYTQPHQ